MISRTLQKRCPSLASHHDIHHPGDESVVVSSDADSAAICSDLAVLEPPRFYPVDLWACRDVFPRPAIPDSCDLLAGLKRETLGLHLFHHHIDEFVNEWKDGTVYREIVARSCPAVAWWREGQLDREEREIEAVEKALGGAAEEEDEDDPESGNDTRQRRRRRLILEAR